jgi:hypothetical protein
MGYDAIAEVVGFGVAVGAGKRSPSLDGCRRFATYMGPRRRGALSSAATAARPKGLRPRARIVARRVKALEEFRFRPMYAGPNMGHPSRTGDFFATDGMIQSYSWCTLTSPRPARSRRRER